MLSRTFTLTFNNPAEDGAYGMGDNDMGQLGIGTNVGKGATVTTPKPVQLQQKVKHAACGFDFTLFVTSKGFLYSAGSSESGQLGINDNGEYIEGRKVRSAHLSEISPSRANYAVYSLACCCFL